MAPASEPTPGSVMPVVLSVSPRMSRGRYRAFWAGEPSIAICRGTT